METVKERKTRNFSAQRCYRLIPSKFPPIHLFEDVASEEEFAALHALQSLTNPRIQEEIGDLSLIKTSDRLYAAPGAGYIMAAFTHINPDGSRFSNGDFGVYYASENLDTAIAETVFHRERFLGYTKEPAQVIDMRTLIAEFSANLVDILNFDKHNHPFYLPNDYLQSQQLGAEIKTQEGAGIVYHSVRSKSIDDRNFALFKPKIIHHCKQGSHYCYVWNGKNISSVYKKSLTTIRALNERVDINT